MSQQTDILNIEPDDSPLNLEPGDSPLNLEPGDSPLNLEPSSDFNSETCNLKLALTAADLPPAVRAFWDSAPASFKVPAILTAIDCYCALATRLRFKYT